VASWPSETCWDCGGAGQTAAAAWFRRTWTKAREAVGLSDLHFHDLRHTGNTMAAGQGASLRELMERMGHSSARAALIYQHATRERDAAIAAGMGKLLRKARRTKAAGGAAGTAPASGTRLDRLETDDHASDLGRNSGAGEGSRTLMTSLEGCGPQPSELQWSRSGQVRQSP